MRSVMKWVYKLTNGQTAGHVVRLENESNPDSPNPKKQIIPYFKENGQSGIPDDLPTKHRIYGLDSVSDYSNSIFIVEGEKCAYALQGLGFQAITSLGGSGQVNRADWSTLDAAEHFYIMPDNDKAGLKYAYEVYQQVKQFRNLKEVILVQFPIREKADVCDYLKTIPELSDWDELESLQSHPANETAREIFQHYLGINAESIPSSWKFIVTKHKHKLISVNDFSQIRLPPRETILFPWLTEGSINMVFADRGIGKTFFCLSCAVALANGESFLSYKADKPVPVLYLDGEMQATAMQERLRHLTNGKLTKEVLSIFTPDCQDLTDHIPDIGDPNGRLEIDELVKAVSPKVVFIDNISTFIRTGHENEGDSWSPVQEWAVQLRKNGIAVVFVHHANKEGKQRGSHKKEDVMDIVIQLKRPDDFLQGTDDTRMKIRYTKSRHMVAFDTQDIEATLKEIDGSLQWTWEAGDLDFHRAMDLLKDGLSMSDVGEELGVSKSTISRWKKKAIEQLSR